MGFKNELLVNKEIGADQGVKVQGTVLQRLLSNVFSYTLPHMGYMILYNLSIS